MRASAPTRLGVSNPAPTHSGESARAFLADLVLVWRLLSGRPCVASPRLHGSRLAALTRRARRAWSLVVLAATAEQGRRELWGRAGVRALGVSYDGTIALGAAAAAAPAVTPPTPLKAAAGWPNCLLLFSAARARRELGLGQAPAYSGGTAGGGSAPIRG